MKTNFQIENKLGIVTLTGDFNIVKVDGFRKEFTRWLALHRLTKNIVIDMTRVEMIDSSGLGLLIAFLKQVRDRGGELYLVGLQKRVSLVFDITRTKRIFEIHPDIASVSSVIHES
ncbi:STAS domain-containing protein [Kiritimatiellota bacterium B12222]|nr:STAS domain-containing protein [Kiritimatiellota bacterium B12222]